MSSMALPAAYQPCEGLELIGRVHRFALHVLAETGQDGRVPAIRARHPRWRVSQQSRVET